MGQAKANAARDERLARERTEKVNDRAMMLAVLGAFLFPSQGGQALYTASRLMNEARIQAERDIPALGVSNG